MSIASPPSVGSPSASPLPTPSPFDCHSVLAGVQASHVEVSPFHLRADNVLITMRDGTRLTGDLYVPAIDGVVEEGRQFPCVLIRTPYNKSAENPDLRSPGTYWTQNGYCCFIQDVRGRFKSEGYFYKYTGEAEDGYDTVEWLGVQSWCNGCVCTDGPSYLAHVQTSMALLRPPHLRAMFLNKGGFYNAWTSGVRNGGAYEARQWIWGVKNAPRKDPLVKECLELVDREFGHWLKRYPFKRGDSPLAAAPDYEKFIFDQASDMEYGDYWKKVGLNTEEHLDDFMDVPCMWLSGWYDIYARSTLDFFANLVGRKKGPHLLIMGPWQHVGPEGHVAGDVDFGVNALISGNLAPTVPALSRRWFDRWVTPAAPFTVVPPPAPATATSSEEKLTPDLLDVPSPDAAHRHPHVRAPSRSPASLVHSTSMDQLALGPSLYIPPSRVPKERLLEEGPLPPTVRYFRMGGGDGHKTSQGCMFHGGVWMAASCWPPVGTEHVDFVLGQRTLTRKTKHHTVSGAANSNGSGNNSSSGSNGGSSSSSSSSASGVSSAPAPGAFVPHMPPASVTDASANCSVFDYDPRNPCPSIGGNVFGHRDVLLAGAFNQVERAGMFLCSPPYLPLSSRGDVVVFRTGPLREKLDVTGMPTVRLVISSSAVDTDFTAKLIDEYPPSHDYPAGYAMQVTHGIRRCRFRNSREKAELMTPGMAYEIEIELYPTSNLFAKGHRLRLDISSSNFPHFDTNPNTGLDFDSQKVVVAQNTVYHAAAYPSRLVLPIQTALQEHMALFEQQQ